MTKRAVAVVVMVVLLFGVAVAGVTAYVVGGGSKAAKASRPSCSTPLKRRGIAMLRAKRTAFGLAAVAAVAGLIMTPGAAAARPSKPRTVSFTVTSTGASINQGNGTLLVVAAFKHSLDGDGALVTTAMLNGNTVTDTGTQYTAKGSAKVTETSTLGAPDANGMIPITGSGNCTGQGTGVYKHAKCSYTYTATVNPTTNVYNANATGTMTR